MTYSIVFLDEEKDCTDCGEPTDMAYVADAVEDATGYRDEVVLCPVCVELRESTSA